MQYKIDLHFPNTGGYPSPSSPSEREGQCPAGATTAPDPPEQCRKQNPGQTPLEGKQGSVRTKIRKRKTKEMALPYGIKTDK